MKVLFVSSEVYPYSQTGGLGEVSASLPQALLSLGQEVRICTPLKSETKEVWSMVLKEQITFSIMMKDLLQQIKIYGIDKEARMELQNEIYFVEVVVEQELQISLGEDYEGYLFAAFSKAVLDLIKMMSYSCDIIHCNDWHTGPICTLLQNKRREDNFYRDIKTIFTVHNLVFQGIFSKDVLGYLGLEEEEYYHFQKLEYYGKINFMKAGLLYGDMITTVSPTYGEEILQKVAGCGLEGVLNERKEDLVGILNGIDYEKYNPIQDPKIKYPYHEAMLERKLDNKRYLMEYILERRDIVNLPVGENPMVIGMIGRTVEQKGFDLLFEILPDIMRENILLLIMGSGDPFYEERLTAFSREYPNQLYYFREFDSTVAQQIYAGIDSCLMPSRFEPCGISQLISMRYGALPIVRRTGGLADTVIDVYENYGLSNGFSFGQYQSEELLHCILNVKRYYDQPFLWKRIVSRAMKSDFSWNDAARKYAELYRRVAM